MYTTNIGYLFNFNYLYLYAYVLVIHDFEFVRVLNLLLREREREREREKRFCESRVSFAIFIIYLAIKKCMHRYYLQNVIGL